MPKSAAPTNTHPIPDADVRAVLDRTDEMREFLVTFWRDNPSFAKQGGRRVAELLAAHPPQSVTSIPTQS